MSPLSYLLCGIVLSETTQTVTITRLGSTEHNTVNTKASTGKFCEYLRPGKYSLQVMVNEEEKQEGIQ